MTPQELIAELRQLGPQDARVMFQFLADRVYQARLAGGGSIHDLSDFSAWLRELGEEAKGDTFSLDDDEDWREVS